MVAHCADEAPRLTMGRRGRTALVTFLVAPLLGLGVAGLVLWADGPGLVAIGLGAAVAGAVSAFASRRFGYRDDRKVAGWAVGGAVGALAAMAIAVAVLIAIIIATCDEGCFS